MTLLSFLRASTASMGLCIALCAPVSRGAVGDSFLLETARTGEIHGPFAVRDGSLIKLGGLSYEMRVASPDRVSFIDTVSGHVYGPAQPVPGRLVEIGGQMYTFRSVTSAGARRAPLPPPPPPPRHDPIPIPPETQPPPAPPTPPRPVLPAPDDGLELQVRLDAIRATPLKWHVSGRQGNVNDLEGTALGLAASCRGWLADAALVTDLHGGDLVPSGLTVAGTAVESGTGWRLGAGYRQPLLRDGGWEVYGGLRVTFEQDQADLESTTASSGSVTNGVRDLVYSGSRSSVTLQELALWLDGGISYSQPQWGIHADVAVVPFTSWTVDGTVPLDGEELSIDAERDQPLGLALGGWYLVDAWRLFTEVAVGTESRIRLGAGYRF